MGRVFVDHKVCEAAGAEIKRQPPCLGSALTPRQLPLKFQEEPGDGAGGTERPRNLPSLVTEATGTGFLGEEMGGRMQIRSTEWVPQRDTLWLLRAWVQPEPQQ